MLVKGRRVFLQCDAIVPVLFVLLTVRNVVKTIYSFIAEDKRLVKGDTLWGIAERFLGAGERYIQIMRANGLNDSWIYPGQVLVIPNGNVIYKTIQITITEDTYTLLSIMADGWNKTIGQVIDAMMEDAV